MKIRHFFSLTLLFIASNIGLSAQTVAPAKQTFDQASPDLVMPSGQNGNGEVTISGELKTWHKITLTQNGPFAHERDNTPNPFTDYSMYVTFAHESGVPVITVP